MTSKDIELIKEMLQMQVYEAYCEKNKINYQRLEEGY